jgi:hypothetical protein
MTNPTPAHAFADAFRRLGETARTTAASLRALGPQTPAGPDDTAATTAARNLRLGGAR